MNHNKVEVMKIKNKDNENLIEILVMILKLFKDRPFEMLVDISQPVVSNVISGYYFKALDRDDLLQIANIVLMESVQEFDVSEKKGFLKFFHMKLQNKMNMMVRRELALKRLMDTESLSLDDLLEAGGDFLYDEGNLPMSPESIVIVNETYDKYLVGLSEFESSVFELYLNGISRSDIAKRLEVKESQVRNALYRCNLKLKDIINKY